MTDQATAPERHDQDLLDDALEHSFPASDPAPWPQVA